MIESRVGRPRDEEARHAVLRATRTLILAEGYESVTMAAIAATAGVGRPTVYRWWRTKESLVTAAVLAEEVPLDPVLATASGDLRADLAAWMRRSTVRILDHDSGALYRALLAAAVLDPEALRSLTTSFSEPLRSAVRSSFAAAGHAGDAEVVADVLIGALLHALVSTDPAAAERIVDVVELVARALAVPPETGPPVRA